MIKEVERLKGLMQVAAERLDFEKAILIRDELNDLKNKSKIELTRTNRKGITRQIRTKQQR